MSYTQIAVFLIDITLGFHTGFYEFVEIVMSRSRIMKKYFQEKFKSNFISVSLIVVNLITKYQFLNFLALIILINSVINGFYVPNYILLFYNKRSRKKWKESI